MDPQDGMKMFRGDDGGPSGVLRLGLEPESTELRLLGPIPGLDLQTGVATWSPHHCGPGD